ncbi:RDD domain containing protein [Halothermothrix orenii H 168]|uniref:RDD domain containing protein n=1 Tax=Halothermothrix orenii (strain H 168 / OCM 544 / DSM 9562) TaxID=373903 RepID=B8CWP9_HALOH|nr:RDD domain containing protein [Halothermothrix orenii H 168]
MGEVKKKYFPSRLKRFLAFLLDIVILCFIIFIIGKSGKNIWISIGKWDWIVGFLVSIAYFGLFNSAIGKGKTPGKRLFKIKVVNKKGRYLSVTRSVLRAAILFFPYFFSTGLIILHYKTLFRIYLTIIITMVISLLYFFLFNNKSHQSLHDLILNTYVVNEKVKVDKKIKAEFKNYLKHLAIITVIIFTGILIYTSTPVFSGIYQGMTSIYEVCSNVRYVNSFIYDDETDTIVVEVCLKEKPESYKEIARQIARSLFKNKLVIHGHEIKKIKIKLKYGYNLILYNEYITRTFYFDKDEITGK